MKYNWKEYESFLEERLRAMRVPGAQVCVRDETGVVFEKSYGFKDGARTLPVDGETMFGIASMSKSVTCFALALLEHQGKLSFDDPVCRFIPDFKIPGIPKEAVLIRHLCSHTAGLPPLPTLSWSMKWNTPDDPWETETAERIRAGAGYRVDKVQDITDYIAAGEGFEILGQPGEYMSYSNDGYALLSAIVDAASGETLESFAQREIFDKLGMKRTTFDTWLMKSWGNCTSLFSDVKGEVMCSDNWDVAPPYRGCGWIKSTASDMTRYYLMLSQNGMFEGEQLFPASCAQRLMGREFPEKEEPVYCFGLLKRLFGDAVICCHTGSLKGVCSVGSFIKDGSFAVTVLTNAGFAKDRYPLAFGACNLRLGLPVGDAHDWCGPSEYEPEDLSVYTGRYVTAEAYDGEGLVRLGENGRLKAVMGGQKFDLVYAGGTTFMAVPEGSGAKQGEPVRFYFRDGRAWGLTFGMRIVQRRDPE